ncbi:hypothetical protein IAR55_003420 [Kwoniella newhampshirensis]|uniref:Uncharacterized protein n=1 Tax=Kwoniella newhampshirensis TaxID=1651941 RepID=A0AAW0YQV6_9TREE
MTQPTSPLLFNSSFSQFDYFARRSSTYSSSSSSYTPSITQGQQNPTFTLSLTDSPVSSSSSSASYSRRSSPSLPPASQFLTTPERHRNRASSPPIAARVSSLGQPAEISTSDSPKVLSSPRTELRKKAARRSVQIGGGEKTSTTVNWARPLRVEQEHLVQESDIYISPFEESNNLMRIFGASLQRSRRLNRSTLPSPASSSPSSEVGPLTPSPVIAASKESPGNAPQRAWSVMMAQGKGLGVSGVVAWDTPLTTPSRELDIEFNFEPLTLLPSATSSSISPRTSTPSQRPVTLTPSPSSRSSSTMERPDGGQGPNARLLATSQSLNSFSSPANLEELQILRRAAVELAAEARRPIRSTESSHVPGRDVTSQKERKIKRKAVPSMMEFEFTLLEPPIASSPSSSASSHAPETQDHSPARRASLVERVIIPREIPGTTMTAMGKDIFAHHRQFYQNHMATQSVIEVSPRTKQSSRPFNLTLLSNKQKNKSVPVSTPPPGLESRQIPINPAPMTSSSLVSSPTCTTLSSSSDNQRSSSDSSSSSSLFLTDPEQEGEADQPMTPNTLSASQTELFIVSVENAFKKLEFERAEMKSREMFTSSSVDLSLNPGSVGGVAGGKHKRGLSRFLGKDKMI